MSEWDVPYQTPEPAGAPNWRWMTLWEQENPQPDAVDFDAWWAEYKKMRARVWSAFCLPQFRVWDWSDLDVALVRGVLAGHACSVCGRFDDPGCVRGC